MEYVMEYESMQKQIIGAWKIMIKKFESSYLLYLDVNNLYGWEMSQKMPVNGFKWKKILINLMKSS